jgi:hypothetical protein
LYCGNLKTRRRTAGIAIFSRTKSHTTLSHPYICSPIYPYNSTSLPLQFLRGRGMTDVYGRVPVSPYQDWRTASAAGCRATARLQYPTPPTVGALHLSLALYQGQGLPLLSQRPVGRVALSRLVGAHLGYCSRAAMQQPPSRRPEGLPWWAALARHPAAERQRVTRGR